MCWLLSCAGGGGKGGDDRLRPGTFFKPPLIRASVRGSPGWSELPHWRQSEAVISAGAGDDPRCLVNTWTRLFWRADVGPEIDDRMPKIFSRLSFLLGQSQAVTCSSSFEPPDNETTKFSASTTSGFSKGSNCRRRVWFPRRRVKEL